MSEITILELDFILNNHSDIVFPVIVSDEKDMVMIDCGYPGSLPMLERDAAKKGIDLSKLTKVIITHHDFDHQGALGEIKAKYPHVEVIASKYDKDVMEGRETSIRLIKAEEKIKSKLKSDRNLGYHSQMKYSLLKKVHVDRAVEDKEVIDCCGGIEIVATPGHMPGHISVYLREHKAVVTGDALVIYKGRLHTANGFTNIDNKQAKKSAEKLLKYDIDRIICFHGGEYPDDIKESILKLVG